MKTRINHGEENHAWWFTKSWVISNLICCVLMLQNMNVPLLAQTPEFTTPTWWFGVSGGANFNFYRGTTQQLKEDLIVPAAFHHGNGLGLYVAPLVEFHPSYSKWGIMLQAGYDGRNGSFDHVITPCNCRADLSTNLRYITVEPSARFAPFRSNLYLFAGPRIAYNIANSFTYKLRINPDFPEQTATDDVKGDFSETKKLLVSMQVGAGYDIPLSSQFRKARWILSPFVSFQPYFGQDPRSIETWTNTTVRVGAAFKVGYGHPSGDHGENVSHVRFSVTSPANIPVERKVRETFPLRNYVYFNIGSTEIPDRYVLLTSDQVKDFKENQLEVNSPKTLSGRSAREMTVYYNILNILGDRMDKNPSATIHLVGSSEQGTQDGKAMAQSVKKYLTGIFSISSSRITTEGRNKPKIASEQPGGTLELDLLREGDRRVSIESNVPAMLMEFQSGPEAPLRPVEILVIQQAPIDSYVSFNVEDATKLFSYWSLEIRDEKGATKYFGPYMHENVRLPGKAILGTRPEGNYKVKMIGVTKNGKTVLDERPVHIMLWTPPKDDQGMRFSVIFEFNDSTVITMYEKYLTDIVVPKIPRNATVIIQGYTDIIGESTNNRSLSIARANEIKRILEARLGKTGRTDVKFEVYGFGEDEAMAQFENKLPEERAYNRSVVIDVIPYR